MFLLSFGIAQQDLDDIPTNKAAGTDSLYAWEINRIVLYLQHVADSLGLANYQLKLDFKDSLSASAADEIIQDLIGGMLSGNTETNITVTYQDADGTIDFVVTFPEASDVDTTGTKIAAALGARVENAEFDTYLATATADEIIADFIGTMLTGNTETNITVTYQDADNTIDFVVSTTGDSTWDNLTLGTLKGIDNHTLLEDTLEIGAAGIIFGFADITDLDSLQTDTLVVSTYVSLPTASINATMLAANSVANSEMADDAIGSAEMANEDHGDVAWSNGVASVQDVDTSGTKIAAALSKRLEVGNANTTYATIAGETYSGAHDFGGATSIEVVNGTNPTTDAAGEISVDTNNHFIEFYSDASRVLGALQCRTFTLANPDSLPDEVVLFHVMADAYPHGITIKDIAISASANMSDTHVIEEWSTRAKAAESTVESITLAATQYQEDDGTLSDASIAADAFIAIDRDAATDDVASMEVTITFWINAGD